LPREATSYSHKCDRGTPCLLGSTGIPCISIPWIVMGLGRVVGRLWLSRVVSQVTKRVSVCVQMYW
jgi:hypothetical protein